jgi:hypothetical protein
MARPPLADAVFTPVPGPPVDRLAALETRDNMPSNGNALGSGRYASGRIWAPCSATRCAGRSCSRLCGCGSLAACRASLPAALDVSAAGLAAAQGRTRRRGARTPPSASRTASCRGRCGSRATVQQVMSFTGHRPHP